MDKVMEWFIIIPLSCLVTKMEWNESFICVVWYIEREMNEMNIVDND